MALSQEEFAKKAPKMLEEIKAVLNKYELHDDDSYLIVRTKQLRLHANSNRGCKPPKEEVLDWVFEKGQWVLRLVCK